jgi:hypothetical protein
VLGFYTVTSELVEPPLTFSELHQLNARCDVGDSVTGGGFRMLGFSEFINDFGVTDNIVPTSSRPIDGSVGFGEGWGVMAKFPVDHVDLKLVVFAVCADLTP